VGEFDPVEPRSRFEWAHVVTVTPASAWAVAELDSRSQQADDPYRDRPNSLAGSAGLAGVAVEIDVTVGTDTPL
jgi:hypothetical protein